jgi:hypothetical protein
MEIQLDGKIPLGEGGYGSVFPGKYQGSKVAVKRVLLIGANGANQDHPNIVKCFHYETDDNFK